MFEHRGQEDTGPGQDHLKTTARTEREREREEKESEREKKKRERGEFIFSS